MAIRIKSTLIILGIALLCLNTPSWAQESLETSVKIDSSKLIANRLIELLIDGHKQNDPAQNFKYCDFQRYEKIVISLNDFTDIDTAKSLSFLNQHAVPNPYSQKDILPMSLHDKLYYSTRGAAIKRPIDSIAYSTRSGIDDRLTETSIMAMLNGMMPQIDLFDEKFDLANNQFISPLSKNATYFYRYAMVSDTTIDSHPCATIEFTPRTIYTLAPSGQLYIDRDSTDRYPPFIRKIIITIPKGNSVNFLERMYFEKNFTRDTNGYIIPTFEILDFDISPLKDKAALNISRTNSFSYFTYTDNKQQHIENKNYRPKIEEQIDDIQILSEKEIQAIELTKKLRSEPLWRVIEEAALICTDGYLQTGKKSYFDIGPIERFAGINKIEGFYVFLGGMTTPNLSKHFFLEGLIGYGFKDKKLKYDLSAELSFTPKEVTMREFPNHSLRFTYRYDTYNFCYGVERPTGENIFTSIKRVEDSKISYIQLYQLHYQKEWHNHMSLNLYARNYTVFQSSEFSFAPASYDLYDYTVSEAEIRFRYAPSERLYQTRFSRRDLNKYSAEFEISHITGFKNIINSDFSRNLTTLWGEGRVNAGFLGYIDIYGALGHEWNIVPYMLLPHPNTNLSYITSKVSSLSMMQPLEFMYDRYSFLGVDYHLNGLVLGNIPWVKKLKLREVFTFRGLYGNLSNKNNPTYNTLLLPFPDGSQPIGKEPYMEVGAGIENIFSILRIDYVWRLNYLDKPNVGHGAILLNLSISF